MHLVPVRREECAVGMFWIAILVMAVWILGLELLLTSRFVNVEKGFANRRGEQVAFGRPKILLMAIGATVVASIAASLLADPLGSWVWAIFLGQAAAVVVVLLFEAVRLAIKHPWWALLIVAFPTALLAACYFFIPGLQEFIATMH